MKIVILNCNNILQYYSFTVFFDLINAGLVSMRDLFLKTLKHLTNAKLLNGSVQ